MKHDWRYFERWGFTACEKCGVVQNAKNIEKDNCKGYVRVGPRKSEQE